MIFIEKKVKIYGLPRSGTNFLEFILSNNLNLKIALFDYGWKHDFPQKEIPFFSIAITKNIHYWLWSIYNYAKNRTKIFHIPEKISFFDFIKREYVWDADIYGPGSPQIFHYAKNPILHWNKMNKSWIKSYFIKYEDLALDPNKYLIEISSKLKIKKNKNLIWPATDINPGKALSTKKINYNNFNIDFIKNKEYMKNFTSDSLFYVDSFVDKNLIDSIGYDQL